MTRRPPFYTAEPRVCIGCGHHSVGRCGHPHDSKPTPDDGWCAWWKPFGHTATFTQMPAPAKGRRSLLDRLPPRREPAPAPEPIPAASPGVRQRWSHEQIRKFDQLPAWQQEIILREQP